MKQQTTPFRKFLVLILIVLATGVNAQTIRIADNNSTRPTGANIYPTLQAAVNAAVPGDLVYVQPSPTSYGDITIDRQITLRGIGFNTGKDIALSSTVGNIGLTNTVTNATNASGTVIEGVVANIIYMGFQTGTFSYTFQNITISNCSVNFIFHGTGYMPASNITIQTCSVYYLYLNEATVSQLLVYGNFFTGGIICGTYANVGGTPACCSSYGGTMSSVIFSNNIITQTTNNQFNTTVSAMAITNNIFIGGTDKPGSRFISGRLTDATVTNNIFYGTTPDSNGSPFERNSFLNNISFGTSNDALPPTGSGVGNTGSGNQVSVDPKFVNAPYAVVYAATMDFTLQPTSPGKNAGTDGTDIGITGGAYPVTSGNFLLKTPHAPVIMTLNPAAIVPQGQPIQTNIKAKSN